MAVSPEVMQANGGAPPPGGAPPGAPPPAAGPMLTPQKPEGQHEGARVDVLMALKMLEKALAAYGSSNEEGKSILKAISSLARKFGKTEQQTEELMPAEIKQLLQGLAGPGAPPKPGAAPGAPPPGA